MEEKKGYWEGVIKRWEGSNISQRKFCKEHEIKYGTFKLWRYRLKTKGASKGRLLSVKLLKDINPRKTSSSKDIKDISINISNSVQLTISKISINDFKEIIGGIINDTIRKADKGISL